MPTILDTIVQQKRAEVRALGATASRSGGRPDPRRPFAKALSRLPKLSLIAEVKKASPSRGVICADFRPVDKARQYEAAGASAISVLTDARFFQGSLEHLVAVREATSLPVLRKDFIIDPLQVEQTALAGADAVLLIAAILSNGQMRELCHAAQELDVETLVEVHNGRELDRAMYLSPRLIGINNRDLATFVTDLATTLDLVGSIPSDIPVVSESGIHNGAQTATLMKAGVSAILVGESLMTLDDPAPRIRELVHADTN